MGLCRLLESKLTIPHYYLSIDVEMDTLMQTRAQLNAMGGDTYKLSVNDFVVKVRPTAPQCCSKPPPHPLVRARRAACLPVPPRSPRRPVSAKGVGAGAAGRAGLELVVVSHGLQLQSLWRIPTAAVS